MQFKINKTYKGFKLVEEKYINELESTARIFEHTKSHARLLSLQNTDDNKVFSIGFRTPPENSKGAPHIVEHCVLSGSRKYTTKEPFMDMIKGSLQTFINAMTFSDKTIYPIASRNTQDFKNLMDVYLDAVFFPKMYEKEEIFMQEGWHYEILEKDADIEYKGVVYNEMKGAYSSPESIVSDAIQASLYPDTCYSFSSGGDPKVIPELSYEEFLNFHKKFYHPSNSYIFLYGDMDLLDRLEYLDREYLSKFDFKDINSDISPQESFDEIRYHHSYYNLADDELEENKSYLSLNFVLGESSNPLDNIMNKLLNDFLINASGSPIRKIIMDLNLAEDILPSPSDGIQTNFGIILKNANLKNKDKFKTVFFDTIKDLVENGINKKLIEASLNVLEFDLREAEGFATKGLIYAINSLESWLYDESPLVHLEYSKTIDFLKSQLNTDFYEKYLEEKILNNSHASFVVVEPKKHLTKEQTLKDKEFLCELKSKLSSEELSVLIEKNKALSEMQLKEDSLEDKLTIPRLDLSNVNTDVMEINQKVINKDKYTILFNDIFTNRISYIDLLFDSSVIEEEYLPYITLLTKVLGEVDSKSYSYDELDNEVYIHTGGISFSAFTYPDSKNKDIHHPKLAIRTRVVHDKISKFIELLNEIVFNSDISNKKRLKEICQQLKSRIEMIILQAGHSVASARLMSYFSPVNNYNEKLNGLDFFWFVSNLVDNFDDNFNELVENLNYVYNKIFNLNNMIISFTGSEEDFDNFNTLLKDFTKNLNTDLLTKQNYSFKEEQKNEAIKANSNVQYVAKGYNFKELGYNYQGQLAVLSRILNNDYLHNRVRAKGGAYGVGISFNKMGNLTVSSYRDPNLKETLDTYDNIAEFIENMYISELDLNNYIIGALGSMDPALTASSKGAIATSRYISNVDINEIKKIKEDVKNTSLDDLKKLSPLLKDSMEKNFICVLGNEEVIEKNKLLFNSVIKLNK